MARRFQIRKLVIAVVLLASLVQAFADEPTAAWGNWTRWGDQGDRTYRNPVLPADYSDLDCIRNWRILGHVIDDPDANRPGAELGLHEPPRDVYIKTTGKTTITDTEPFMHILCKYAF